jgi:anti-sigma factor RsiW
MSCDYLRERQDNLWEDGESAELARHLAECPACAREYRDLRVVRAGLRLMKREAAPEPSIGFAQRLVRQLGELGKAPSVADFFEQAGRRFVYATLVLTFLALLAIALPSTGPVRGLTIADIQMSSQETLLANTDPLGGYAQESPDQAPEETPAPAVPNEVK